MKKKIIGIFVCMLVIAMLLLMPSIPAIQQKTIDVRLDKEESEILTKLQDLDIHKIKALLNEKSFEFTPLLLTCFIASVYTIRVFRGLALVALSLKWDGLHLNVEYPIINLRGAMLIESAFMWARYWHYLFDIMGWNWILDFSEDW